MHTIQLHNVGKRFNKDWIFKSLDYTFTWGHHYVILGKNGSGKSTLLQCIAGFTNPSAGKIEFENHTADMIFKSISIAAPYLELIEEMTANEQIDFHKKFKGLLGQISNETLLEKTGLKDASTKEIRNFSSGMKQRLKLGLAFFSDCPFLLLDEPCSNLDKEGQQIYLDLVEQVKHDKLIIVASNDPVEYQFCQHQIDIMQFKS